MKKVHIFLFLVMFISSAIYAQTEIYLPKTMTYTTESSPEIKIREEYSFDNEFRMTKALYRRKQDNNPNNATYFDDFQREVSIKYNKKTGRPEKVDIKESSYDDKRDEKYQIKFMHYKFSYINNNQIDVELKLLDIDKEFLQGDIEINDKDEMLNSGIEKFVQNYRIEYDANSNLIELKQGAQMHTLSYGTQKGIFCDTKTPKWIYPFVFDNYDRKTFFRLDRGMAVNSLEMGVEERPSHSDPSIKEIIEETFTYTCDTKGYPISYKSQRKNKTENTVLDISGTITYEIKKEK